MLSCLAFLFRLRSLETQQKNNLTKQRRLQQSMLVDRLILDKFDGSLQEFTFLFNLIKGNTLYHFVCLCYNNNSKYGGV